MNENRIVYPDLLRIIATCAVIILHVCGRWWDVIPINTMQWQIINAFDASVRWAVPVFVMISGMFFLNPEKEVTSEKIIKHIKRIIIALIVWGLFYQLFFNVLSKMILHHEAFSIEMVLNCLKSFLFGPPWYHLWFLYMIIGLYILIPVYRVFTKNANEKQFRYAIIIFFIFGLGLPFIKKVLLQFDSAYNIYFEISELINYSGYFIAGYYLSKYSFTKKTQIVLYLSGFLSLLITIIISAYLTKKNQEVNSLLFGNLLPTTMLEAFSIFILIKEILNKKELSGKTTSVIINVSSCTFGIYLIHDFIRTIIEKIGITATFINPIIAIPFSCILIFLISWLIVFILKKIPIIKSVI